MVTVPPAPVVAPEAKVTLEAVTVQLGASVAPVGDVARMHELSVIVIGPVYPPEPAAVIADVPFDPGATVTAAAERV
jgi:hypothetical protein